MDNQHIFISDTGLWEIIKTTGNVPSVLQEHTIVHYKVRL